MFDLEIADRSTVVDLRDKPDSGSRFAVAIALLPLRLFLAGGWLRAASEKLLDPDWWNGEFLAQFVADQQDQALPFFGPVLSEFVLPNAIAVSVLVVLCQLAVGLFLLVGHRLQFALRLGVLMNVIFVLSGRVNPSVFYLVMELSLLYAIAAGWLGARSERTEVHPLLSAAGWSLAALTLSRWIKTIEPEGVIEDPAMVLTFLCVIMATTALLKAVTSSDYVASFKNDLGSRLVRNWLLCWPRSDSTPR